MNTQPHLPSRFASFVPARDAIALALVLAAAIPGSGRGDNRRQDNPALGNRTLGSVIIPAPPPGEAGVPLPAATAGSTPTAGGSGAPGTSAPALAPVQWANRIPGQTPKDLGFRYNMPSRATSGVPLTLSVYAPPPLANPVLMFRRASETRYRSREFSKEVDGYYVVELTEEEIQAPGLDHYIVIDTGTVVRELAVGDPATPVTIPVQGYNKEAQLKRYGAVDWLRASSEYVAFPRKPGDPGPDYYGRTETEYLCRTFRDVHSYRFGTGYLNGRAVKDAKARDSRGREITVQTSEQAKFLYAYIELEFAGNAEETYSIILRPIFGALRDGSGGGLEGRMRFGDELGVNLVLGGTVLSKIGNEAFIQFTTRPAFPVFVTMSTYLGDLPVSGQTGFRVSLDIKHRMSDRTAVIVRNGAAARSTDRIGYNGGLGFELGL